MKTALWETSSGALVALLNSGVPLNVADLYTLTLGNGTKYYWSGASFAISGNGKLWVLGPGITRDKIRSSIGTSTDDLTVTITDNVLTKINGQSLMAFIRAGGFLGARFQVDKAYWPKGASQPTGALFGFEGSVQQAQGTRYGIDLTVSSDMILLDTQIPRELFQASCLNTVYDSACTLASTSFQSEFTATTVSDAGMSTFGHSLPQAAGYFDQGFITGITGANAGLVRSVKTQTTSTLQVLNPWGFPVAVGDSFQVVAGCDGTQATCTSKFSNLPHFRGQPYIPTSDSIM